MAHIELPSICRSKLGSEMKMDVHWIDVQLKDRRVFRNLVVRGGAFITGRASDTNGDGDLGFTSSDILRIRRHSPLSLWPFW